MPVINVDTQGVLNFGSTLANGLNKRPSVAIVYTIRGIGYIPEYKLKKRKLDLLETSLDF